MMDQTAEDAWVEAQLDGHDLPPFIPLPALNQGPVEPPPFQRPLALLTFSYTPERKLVWDDSAMKFYKNPPLNAPLDRDYDKWIKRPEERGRLDGLLRALRRKAVRPEAARADVVTWRGVMTKFVLLSSLSAASNLEIITAPYETREGWDLNAMFVNDCLYIEEHLNDAKLREKENMTPQHRLASYYGYAFESYCTTDRPLPPGYPPQGDGWGGPVDTNVQWCSVVKTKLGNLRIIMGAEVDCVRDKFTGQPDTFVELKTSQVIRNQRDEQRFESKMLKYWAQSYLLGIPEVIVGFRTQDGRIANVQSFQTLDFTKMAKQRGEWDGGVCLEFGFGFLTHMLRYTRFAQKHTKDPIVWRISFKPGSGMTIRDLDFDTPEYDEVVNGEDREGFLPNSYYEHVRPQTPELEPEEAEME
ncbi:decapping endonuclease targeting mRNA [Tulasnella sp. 408]|nr:decapping endonuclease targeting mRNA [Tulasnella sp. 408]